MPQCLGRSALTASDYQEHEETEWDELVSRSPMATLLHTRAFLGYHGSRLGARRLSRASRQKGGNFRVMPAAVMPGGSRGWKSSRRDVRRRDPCGRAIRATTIESFGAIASHYLERGFELLVKTTGPVHLPPATQRGRPVRVFAAAEENALRAVVRSRPGAWLRLSSRRRRGLSKARRERVEVGEGPELVSERGRSSRPTSRAPRRAAGAHGDRDDNPDRGPPGLIHPRLARLGAEPVAGVVLFETSGCPTPST